jgi:hypothetical protein
MRFSSFKNRVFCLAFLAAAPLWAATRISTTFMGVSLKDLAAGQSHDLAQASGRSLTVKNEGDKTVVILIDAEPAAAGMLLKGYSPLPDPAWIDITPREFTLAPGQSFTAQARLSIPAGRAYRGKKLQGALWIRTKPQTQMSVGLRVKVPFTVSKKS